MNTNNKENSTLIESAEPNKYKCIFKHFNIECNERFKCDGTMKVGCPLSEIANVKPSETILD